jgi:hypothetical protein
LSIPRNTSADLSSTAVKVRRLWCRIAHNPFHWREHFGFGWYGWHCRRCGFTFFADWTDEQKRLFEAWGYKSQLRKDQNDKPRDPQRGFPKSY